MLKRYKRGLSIFLLCAFCLGLWVPVTAEAADEGTVTYTPFDLAEFIRRADMLEQISAEAVNAPSVLIGFGGLERLYRECATAMALAQLNYRENLSDDNWAQIAQMEQRNLQKVQARIWQVAQTILSSPCATAAQAAWGEEMSQKILDRMVPDEAELALLEREQALLAEYDKAYRTAFDVRYGGRLVTTNNPWQVDLGVDYWQAAFAQGNAVLGPIFQELVQVRTQLAHWHGYDTYTDYAYHELYGRDYMAAESEKVRNDIAAYFVPLLEMLVADWQQGSGQWMPATDVSEEECLDLLAVQLSQLAPQLTEAYSCMRRQQLYNAGSGENRFSVSYTVFLPQYGSAFMQTTQTGDVYDWFNLVHEFGHYNNYYQNADDYTSWLLPVNYDLAELHSQGLEMLMAARYEHIWGKESGRAMTLYHLISKLDVAIQACLEDEFQQGVYAKPDMSLDEMNKLYSELKEKYHVLSLGDSDGSWVLTPNTYHSPLSAMSYAISMINALELWHTAKRNEKAAVNQYLQVVSAGERTGYQTVLSENYLSNPLQDGTIKKVAQSIGSHWGYSNGQSSYFLDVYHHWAQQDIYRAVQAGLFAGTEPMIFQPDAPLKRGMVVVLLSRVRKANLSFYNNRQVFADVAPDNWCASAVAWAAENGLVSGVSEELFAPDEPVSREQLAVMLNALLKPDKTIFRPVVFADKDDISPWAIESVERIAELGLMQGRPDGTFAPQDALSRAEAAVILLRLQALGNSYLRPLG